jgi:hypothetical protein
LPAGAINAVFGNRLTNKWGVAGEELAAGIALDALVALSKDESMAEFISRRLPASLPSPQLSPRRRSLPRRP